MSKGHVLFIPSWYVRANRPHGGSFFADQAVALSEAGWRVGVIFPEILRWREGHLLPNGLTIATGPEWTTSNGIRELRVKIRNPPVRRLRAWYWMAHAERLASIYFTDEGMPDLLHAQSFLWGGCVGARISNAHRVPLVVTEHSSTVAAGEMRGWEEALVRRAAPRANRVLAVSRSLARSLAPYMPGKDIAVVPNVVDTTFFNPGPSDSNQQRPNILCVANLVPRKGVDILLKAFANVSTKMNDARLRIVGDGSERARLEAAAIEQGVGEAVTFLGVLDRHAVRREMRSAAVLAVPSRVETFGVVAIEALACGTPVIAVNVGGLPEIVREPFGYVVAPEAPDQMADALLAVLSGPRRFRKSDAWKHIERLFGVRTFTRTLEGLYSALPHQPVQW